MDRKTDPRLPSASDPRTPPIAHTPFHLGGWRIDPDAREATDGQRTRRLSPRAIGVLSALAEARGDVVSRAELMQRVWPGIFVSDESLTQAVSELRRLFTDRGVIETIAKSGYRLTVPVLADVPDEAPRALGGELFDLEAYALCLEARSRHARCGVGGLAEAQLLTARAACTAPGFALARAEHSLALVRRHLFMTDGSELLRDAAAEAEAALRLKPDLPLAHLAQAFALAALGRGTLAEAALRRAITLDPTSADVHLVGAKILLAKGDHETATVLAERASALDPHDIQGYFLAARSARAFDPARARRASRAALERVRAHLAGDPEEARAVTAGATCMALLGERETALAALAALDADRSPMEYYHAVSFAIAGEIDAALSALERVVDHGWRYFDWLDADPTMAALSGERRFQRVRALLCAA